MEWKSLHARASCSELITESDIKPLVNVQQEQSSACVSRRGKKMQKISWKILNFISPVIFPTGVLLELHNAMLGLAYKAYPPDLKAEDEKQILKSL